MEQGSESGSEAARAAGDRTVEAKRLAERLNILPIAAFCIWLAMVILFWGRALGPLRGFETLPPEIAAWPWLIVSVLAGGAVLAIPDRFFRLRQVERSGRLHEMVGARAFRGFVTNGDHINRIVSRRYGEYRVHRHGDLIGAAARTMRQSERSHLVCFVAGMVTCAYAATIGWWDWAIAMLAANVLTNFYPVLVQRHTRARLMRIADRRG